VSNFLCWYLYYDIVQLPESPCRWYKHIYSMEMQGWIALGSFLASGTDYGLDLVVLHSICDRLRLNKRTVFCAIVRVADPEQMTWTSIAATFQTAKEEYKSEVEALEDVQNVLMQLRAIAASVKPVPRTEFAYFQGKTIERIREFLDYVVNPRINALREDALEPYGVWEEETRALLFYFQAMQQPRQVPLIRYGIFPDSLLETYMNGSITSSESSSAIDRAFANQCEVERSFSATSLKSEIRLLRNHIATLEKEKQNLVRAIERGTSIPIDQPAEHHSSGSGSRSNSNRVPHLPVPVTEKTGSSAVHGIDNVFRSLNVDNPPVDQPQSSLTTGGASSNSTTFGSRTRVVFADPIARIPETAHSRVRQPAEASPIPPPHPGLVPHVPSFNYTISAPRSQHEASKMSGTTLVHPERDVGGRNNREFFGFGSSSKTNSGTDRSSGDWRPMSQSAASLARAPIAVAKNAVRKLGRRNPDSAVIDDSDMYDDDEDGGQRKRSFSGGFNMLLSTQAARTKGEDDQVSVSRNF
jgi:hypothetical protein